jgi:hypothetical protein
MPKRQKRGDKSKEQQPDVLKGWQKISAFLGGPPSVVQRWAQMECRSESKVTMLKNVETTPEELNAWLGKESG